MQQVHCLLMMLRLKVDVYSGRFVSEESFGYSHSNNLGIEKDQAVFITSSATEQHASASVQNNRVSNGKVCYCIDQYFSPILIHIYCCPLHRIMVKKIMVEKTGSD